MLMYGIGYWIPVVIFHFCVKSILKIHLQTNFIVSLKLSLKYSCNTPEYTFKRSTLSSPTYSRTYHDLFFQFQASIRSSIGQERLTHRESRPCVLCIYKRINYNMECVSLIDTPLTVEFIFWNMTT